ncbi:MAG: hypothetical protein ACPGGN_00840 [Opitutales bacterium]
MKTVNLLVTTISLFTTPLLLHSNVDESNLHILSKYWPSRVTLTEEVIFSSEDDALTIPEGWSGILSRVEGEMVLIDFGRDGVRQVRIDQTDILDSAEQLVEKASDREDFRNDLYITRLYNKFFVLEEDREFRSTQLYDFEDVNYLLVCYVDFKIESSSGELLALQEHSELLQELGVLPVALALDIDDDDLLENVFQIGWHYPVMYGWITPSYLKMFAHQRQSHGYSALIDSNGRLLNESDLSELIEEIQLQVENESALQQSIQR